MAVFFFFCSFFILFSLDHQANANRVPDGKSCVTYMGRKGNYYKILDKNLVENISENGVVLKLTAMKKTVTV